jgi:hypothetical protein
MKRSLLYIRQNVVCVYLLLGPANMGILVDEGVAGWCHLAGFLEGDECCFGDGAPVGYFLKGGHLR